MVGRSTVIGTLRTICVFVCGWLSAHQWFIHHHASLTSDNSPTRQFSPHSMKKNVGSQDEIGTGASKPTQQTQSSPFIMNMGTIDGRYMQHSYNRSTVALKPSWHRLLDCSVFAIPDCFAAEGVYEEFPTFDEPLNGEDSVEGSVVVSKMKWTSVEEHRARARHAEIARTMETIFSSKRNSLSSLWNQKSLSPMKRTTSTAPLPKGTHACPAVPKLTGSNEEEAYDASLLGLASDAKRTGVRAAFTMADKNYAHHIGEVSHVS
jgi:hypothetical protein